MLNRSNKLEEEITKLQTMLQTCITQKDFEKVMDTLKNFPYQIDYYYRYTVTFSMLALLVIGVLLFSINIVLALAYLGIAPMALSIISQKSQERFNARLHHLRLLPHTIFGIKTVLDQGLTAIPFKENIQHEPLLRKFLFHQDHISLYTKRITSLGKGEYQGDQKSFPFHFVEVRYVHYDEATNHAAIKKPHQLGIVLPFKHMKSMIIATNTIHFKLIEQVIDTSSIEFNDAFRVHGTNTRDLMRFLKPSVVETILNTRSTLEDLYIEMDNAGNLLLLTAKKEKYQSTKRIQNMAEYIQMLEKPVKIEELNQLFKCAEKLLVLSDNNFES